MATRFVERTADPMAAPGDTAPNVALIGVDSDDEKLKFYDRTNSATLVAVTENQTQTLTNKTLTSPTLNTPTLTAPTVTGASTGIPVCKIVNFAEQAGTTLTGTITIPAGAILLDIFFVVTVLAGGTSASLTIGDADDPDGWFAATDLKATDLLVGEVLSIRNVDNWGGKQGVYLVAASGRMGRTTAGVDSGIYYGAASTVTAVITQGTPSTTGRYKFGVIYVIPEAVAEVVA